MPLKKACPYEIDRKFSIKFSTPTEDITTLDSFHKYFSSECTYNVVPGLQNSSLTDVEPFLLQILPYTKNLILDITLPFIQVTKKNTVIKHLARYLIVDRILHGIRIKINDNWPRSKNIKLPISANLQEFYDQNYIRNYPKQIIVGEFILATRHFKLAPLFSSELSSLLDNMTYSLLNDYYSLGCEIFSIVNDLNEEKKKTLKDPFEIIKNYRRETTVCVCSGMHVNVDSSQTYKSKSYAIQTSDRLKKIHVTKLDQIYTQTFIADLNQTKRKLIINDYDLSKVISSDIQIVDCRNLRIKNCYEKIDFHAIGRFEERMEIQEELDERKIKENDFLMYLWNLYVKFNHRTPFILPLPFKPKDEILIKKIFQLQQLTTLPKADLVAFLKLDPKAKIPKKYQIFNLKTFNLQKIPLNDTKFMAVYFSLKERLLANYIEKDDIFLNQVQTKIINYQGCINEDMFKSLENEATTEQNQVFNEEQKFIEKFLKKKNLSLVLFYFQMARYYPSEKLTQEFLQKMFETLKLMTKKQVTGNPFQAFVLETTYDEVRHIFIECQQKFFSRHDNFKNQEQPENQKAQTQQNNFRMHIKKVSYHVFSQKKSNYTCHMCLTLFNRKLPIPYGRMCIGCSNYVCYSCLDKKTGQNAQSQKQFQQCLICQNKCDCQKCIQKRYKNQGIPDFMNPSKISFFRLSNNLNNCNQNIRINDQPIQNQSKRASTSNINTFSRDHLAIKEQQITIQRCWTCELQNRLERNIRFQCSECKSEKCLDCEKAQNSKRNWVMRGIRLCNKCFEEQQQAIFKQLENKNLKSKIIALEHELNLLKREKFLNPARLVQQQNSFGDYAIVQEPNQNEFQSNHENKYENGAATPIFDRSNAANKESQSPISHSERKNSAQLGSSASFGGENIKIITQDEGKRRKNSSMSSGSASSKSKKSSNTNKKNDLIQTTSKRKNSEGNQKSSNAIFKRQPSKQKSNSSKGSQRSKSESGQYQQSSSENQNKKHQQEKRWNKNHHQNTDQPNYNDMGRGGYRPRGDRGGSWGGNRQYGERQGNGDFKKWQNKRDFKGRNDDRRGSNNRFNSDDRQGGGYNNSNRYNNNDRQGGGYNNNNRYNNEDRQGGFNNNRGQRGKSYDSKRNYQQRNERSFDGNNNFNDDRKKNNDSRDNINNKNEGLLFTSSKASIQNDEDVDY